MEKGKDQDKLREECPDSLKRYRSRHIETIMMMMKKNSCSDQRAMEDYKVCKTKCWIFLGFPRNEDAAGDVSEVADEYMIQNGALLLEKQISSGQCGRGTNSEPLKIFLAEEIRQATNGFDRRLVIGRVVSTGYKGVLDGRVVAITTPQGLPPCEAVINYYLNHITMKQLIHHKNVLKLHGCCLETRVPIYVSEFMSNGSLYDHLHCINVQKNVNAFRISWPDLVRIAMEISHALSYMHCALPKPIVHLDVKSFSIYLDESFTAKLTNFGFSVPLSPEEDVVSTVVFGTLGYTDPEYQQTQRVTEKCDVYSFGILWLRS